MNNISNRAELTGEVEKLHCDNCSEEYLFFLKDAFHEFSLGLVDILECLRFVEEQGTVPNLPPEWWININKRFPTFLNKI